MKEKTGKNKKIFGYVLASFSILGALYGTKNALEISKRYPFSNDIIISSSRYDSYMKESGEILVKSFLGFGIGVMCGTGSIFLLRKRKENKLERKVK